MVGIVYIRLSVKCITESFPTVLLFRYLNIHINYLSKKDNILIFKRNENQKK